MIYGNNCILGSLKAIHFICNKSSVGSINKLCRVPRNYWKIFPVSMLFIITGYTNFHIILVTEALLNVDLEHSDYIKYLSSMKWHCMCIQLKVLVGVFGYNVVASIKRNK